MAKERLSEVINYKEHIAPYRIIELVSGLGSGKNYWVENILMETARVLLITSRKAKVEETMSRTGVDKCLNLWAREQNAIEYLWNDDKRYGSCICNNWQIEHYMKHKYVSGDHNTYLWNFFDIIIVDEAHSLSTDATYCDAPFYLREFIKSAYRQGTSKIVLMTATYEPIKGLVKLKNQKDYAFWDFTKKCVNVKPSKLDYMTREMALYYITRQYNHNSHSKWHAIYFATRTKSIREEIVPYLMEQGIPEENIAVSFSSTEAEEGFSDTLLQNKTRVEDYLKTNEDIPDDIKVFVTTSRNKEGININNSEYVWDIIIESHWTDEIQQMWGRVRSPINYVMLVYDAPQHQAVSVDKDFDFGFDTNAVKLVNEIFDKWCENHDIPKKNRYQNKKAAEKIEMLHEKRFPYMRYSTHDDKFHLYKGKVLGLRSFEKSKNYYEYYIEEWKKVARGERFSNDNLDPIFPIKSFIVIPRDNSERFEEYAQEKGYFNRPITREEKQELLDYVNNELRMRQKKDKSKPYTDLPRAIKELGFKVTECSKHKASQLYGLFRLERIEPISSGGDWDDSI